MFVTQTSTANPPSMSQDEAKAFLGLSGHPFAERVFSRSGIARRCLALSPDHLGLDMLERSAIADGIYMGMALDAIGGLDFRPEEIGTLVVISFHVLGVPTIAHRLIGALGLDPDTPKFHLAGAGCAGAIPVLDFAVRAWMAHPEKSVLVVAIDAASAFLTRYAEEDRKGILNASLFGDGCAALLIGTKATGEGPHPKIVDLKVRQFADTEEAAKFHLGGAAFIGIGQELPGMAREQAGALVGELLAPHGLSAGDIDHWILHPGGRAIVEGFQASLGLSEWQARPSFDVLRDYGNMGTPTSLFVLDHLIRTRRPRPGERGVMVTAGPGITMGVALLLWE
jgi:alkylresorcinol/alkylpyrone synthase